ncbi:MAG: hypothetical protein GXW99_05425 [Clostridiales bacterium]|nr:hypothetical protein [Clostridiales bacterium]
MEDGSITFSTDLDNKELEKQLQSLKKKIASTEDKIAQKKSEQLPIVQQAEQLEISLEKSRKKLEYMQSGKEFFTPNQVSNQAVSVKEIQKEYDSAQKKVMNYDDAIEKASISLNRQKEQAGGIEKQLSEAGKSGYAMGDAMNRASAHMEKFANRVKGLVKRVFVFTVITAALRSIKKWMGKVVGANSEASAAMARLKGALLTMAQPLVDIVIPVFTFFANIITKVVSALAQLFSMLTGKSISSSKQSAKAMYAETDAVESAGDAAEKSQKQLAGFDEINQLSSGDSGSSGSSGGTSGGTAPNFNYDDGGEMSKGKLEGVLELVEAIGAALILWALPKGMTKNFGTFAGILLAIDGIVREIRAVFDAWTNGIDWSNFWQMFLGGAEIVGGLWLAFGQTAGAIGLVVTGLVLLVTGIHDVMENGLNLQNLLTVITGILAAGIGIGILTGNWIPLLIGGIVLLLTAIVGAFGDSEKLVGGFKTILQGFKDFFVGVFSGDIQKAIGGISEVFQGLKTVFFSIIDASENMFNSFLDWIDEKTHGKLHGIIQFVKDLFGGIFQWTKDNIGTVIDTVQRVLTGLIKFISGVFTGNWDEAWQGVKDIFGGIWDGITGLLDNAINAVIRAVNWMIRQLNKISFDAPSWIPVVGGKHFGINIKEIPYLAQGAVIPPNREFMAVLGDQHHGTNVEAPLETIQQAVAVTMQPLIDAMKAMVRNGGGNIALTVNLDGRVVYENVVQRNNAIVRATGQSELYT